MTLSIQIDKTRRAASPLYRQIADGIIRQVEDGMLRRGSRLPTVRDLAEHLSVTRVTVHNAYNDLRARGWADATVGRGTFIVGPPSSPSALIDTISPEVTPAQVMENINRISQLPGSLSLAMAEPDPRFHPTDEMGRLLSSLANTNGGDVFHYGSFQGDHLLRQELSHLLAGKAVQAKPDDILVTTGVTQALSLVTAALCERGDKVVVEKPTYLGFLGLLESFGVEPVGVPLDDQGPRLDLLEKVLVRERPRFFYTVPSFQNPTGVCMSEARRSQLLSLAAEYGLTIVEDDIYSYLAYDQAPPESLQAKDQGNLVIHVDSFSKALLPGLRVGFIVPPPAMKEKLTSLLRVRELCGPPLLQRALAEFLRRGLFEHHLNKVLPIYRRRRDTLIQALDQFMPDEVKWTVPQGGFCSWLTLPDNRDFGELYRVALSRGVAYTPGEVFLPQAESHRHLRLCFGGREESVIGEAISVLAKIVSEFIERDAAQSRRVFEAKPIV